MVSKLVVTGASGLLGQKLVRFGTDSGYDVCSLFHEHRPDSGKAFRVDITNSGALNERLKLENPDVVINTASITDVDLCEREPEIAMRVNATGPELLADACDRVRAFLLHLSTDYVFDGTKGNYSENDAPAPINQYGLSKLIGERSVAKHANACIVRTSVLYGWGRQYRANFATWLYEKLSKGIRVNVVTDQVASPTLNTNLAKMILELAERRIPGIFHLAGSTRASRYEFAIKLANALDFDSSHIVPAKSDASSWIARRPRDSSLDVTKAKKTLRIKPIELSDALREFAREAPKR
jgi:dTDP-4-dehydrorhamnose reductase